MSLTSGDIQAIRTVIREEVPLIIDALVPKTIDHRVPAIVRNSIERTVPGIVERMTRPLFLSVKEGIDRITTTLDEFLKIVRRHEEEWVVIRAQHGKIKDVLIKKHIASENDLAAA